MCKEYYIDYLHLQYGNEWRITDVEVIRGAKLGMHHRLTVEYMRCEVKE